MEIAMNISQTGDMLRDVFYSGLPQPQRFEFILMVYVKLHRRILIYFWWWSFLISLLCLFLS